MTYIAQTTLFSIKEARIVKTFEHGFKKGNNTYTWFVNNGESILVQTAIEGTEVWDCVNFPILNRIGNCRQARFRPVEKNQNCPDT